MPHPPVEEKEGLVFWHCVNSSLKERCYRSGFPKYWEHLEFFFTNPVAIPLKHVKVNVIKHPSCMSQKAGFPEDVCVPSKQFYTHRTAKIYCKYRDRNLNEKDIIAELFLATNLPRDCWSASSLILLQEWMGQRQSPRLVLRTLEAKSACSVAGESPIIVASTAEAGKFRSSAWSHGCISNRRGKSSTRCGYKCCLGTRKLSRRRSNVSRRTPKQTDTRKGRGLIEGHKFQLSASFHPHNCFLNSPERLLLPRVVGNPSNHE